MVTGPVSLDAFRGNWHLQREIRDHFAGQVITGEGSAQFEPDGTGGLVYEETLRLTVPGQTGMTGTRKYLWQGHDQHVQVLFADRSPFHAIHLEDMASKDTHHCPPDLYEGQYDFSRWPVWQARWRVSGPRKDYLMVTVFRR